MPLLCVIPARIGSTRLSEKPLRTIAGTPLVALVARRVLELDLGGRVIVATDDERVASVARSAGAEAVITRGAHQSGTSRVAEVLQLVGYPADVVLNVQGDEPFIEAAALRGALGRVEAGDAIGTAAAPLPPERAGDPSRVKVSIDRLGHATAFSRAPLPAGEGASSWYLQHVGVYAYRAESLARWLALPPVREEKIERLEQLRPLAHGMKIGVALLEDEAQPGIDTEVDLRNAEARLLGREREVTA